MPPEGTEQPYEAGTVMIFPNCKYRDKRREVSNLTKVSRPRAGGERGGRGADAGLSLAL